MQKDRLDGWEWKKNDTSRLQILPELGLDIHGLVSSVWRYMTSGCDSNILFGSLWFPPYLYPD
jgi:hypothetical protein